MPAISMAGSSLLNTRGVELTNEALELKKEGRFTEAINKLKDAEKVFTEALKKDPINKTIKDNLAQTKAEITQIKAKSTQAEFYALNARGVELTNEATELLKEGHPTEAVYKMKEAEKILKEALRKDPRNETIKSNLTRVKDLIKITTKEKVNLSDIASFVLGAIFFSFGLKTFFAGDYSLIFVSAFLFLIVTFLLIHSVFEILLLIPSVSKFIGSKLNKKISATGVILWVFEGFLLVLSLKAFISGDYLSALLFFLAILSLIPSVLEFVKNKLNAKTTLGGISRWVFGAFFLLMGLGSILQHNYVAGILFVLATVISIPPSARKMENKLNIPLSGVKRFFVVLILTIVAFSAIPSENTLNNAQADSQVATPTHEVTETPIVTETPEVTAKVWYDKGYTLYNMGKYEEAIQAYDKAIEIDPRYADAWNNKGAVLENMGKYDEAIQACDKAIEINPQFADAWNNKGFALENMGRYDEAMQAYDKVIEIDPQFAYAWNNKGTVFYNFGKYDEAVQAYNKAIEINPLSADAWNGKGSVLYELAKYGEAIQYYDKAIEINPQFDIAWDNKGNALDQIGRHEEAIVCHNKAAEIKT